MADDPDRTRQRLAELGFRFDPPDVFFFAPVGEVTTAQATAVHDEIDRLAVGGRWFFTIIDLRRVTSISPGARKGTLERNHHVPFRGTALIGGGAPLRVVTTFLMRAIGLLLPRFKNNPVRFFDTEAEARGWLTEYRRALEMENGR